MVTGDWLVGHRPRGDRRLVGHILGRLGMVFASTLLVLGLTVGTAAAHDSGYREQFRNGCTFPGPQHFPGIGLYVGDICNQHDVWYARYRDGHHEFGSHEWGRAQADVRFFWALQNRCGATYGVWDWRRSVCYANASAYYTAVQRYGAPFYYDYNWAW